MKNRFTFFLLIIFSSSKISAQFDSDNWQHFFSFGCRYYYSTLNTWQEPSTKHLHSGIGGTVTFQVSPLFYLEGSSTFFLVHSNPSFTNIHSWNQELNGNIEMPLDDETSCIRFLFGIAHLDWKGNYTGHGFSGSIHYVEGRVLKYQIPEMTIGMGFTKMIGNKSFLDFDVRMRIAEENQEFGLTETAFQIGFRFAPRLDEDGTDTTPASWETNDDNSKTKKSKTENGMPGRKYKWLKRKQK